MRLKGGWVQVADMKEDLGINMQGPVVNLKLDGMLDYEKRQGANYRYKVWRLRCMNNGEEEE
jgi:hypothetical protein